MAKSVGSGDVGSNQPGTSASAADRAIRARPTAVPCAVARAIDAAVKLVLASLKLVKLVSLKAPGAWSVARANSESRPWFQTPGPPATTPHIGSAAVKRPGNS